MLSCDIDLSSIWSILLKLATQTFSFAQNDIFERKVKRAFNISFHSVLVPVTFNLYREHLWLASSNEVTVIVEVESSVPVLVDHLRSSLIVYNTCVPSVISLFHLRSSLGNEVTVMTFLVTDKAVYIRSKIIQFQYSGAILNFLVFWIQV